MIGGVVFFVILEASGRMRNVVLVMLMLGSDKCKQIFSDPDSLISNVRYHSLYICYVKARVLQLFHYLLTMFGVRAAALAAGLIMATQKLPKTIQEHQQSKELLKEGSVLTRAWLSGPMAFR